MVIIQNRLDNGPKVSVIMTTYNAAEHINESIDSVMKQTIEELELLCIDGKSTDGTVEIIKNRSEKDGRVKLFFQDRPGIGAAKNCGIEHSSGEYITFLDADDYYVDENALEIMYESCKKKNVTVCGALRSTQFIDSGIIENEPLHRKDCDGNPDGILLDYKEKQYDYHFHSYLYDRQMIMDSDARFAEVSAYDDTHFFIRAMLKAKKFYVIPVELYRYRCGPAYDWGINKALDAIGTLTDQLILSKKEKLAKLHWLTVQRINYEYGPIFFKNIKNGSDELLSKLIIANNEIDSKLLDYVIENNLIDESFIIPMLHRNLDDAPLRLDDGKYGNKYILEPLWQLAQDRPTDLPYKKRSLFSRGIQCIKDNGLLFTIKLSLTKMKNAVRGK